MLSSKQVFVLVWTVVSVITVDGGLVREKKDVLRQYSNFVVDKSPNAMKISAHDVKFFDETGHNLDFYGEQKIKNSNEASNEIANDLDYYYEENNVRGKRQVDSNEMTEMMSDPAAGDFKETIMQMADTVVDFSKSIADKFSEAFASKANSPQEDGN